MVKGTKRKATMERITKRESAATTFTKRTYGLHSKIAQLCLLTDAQIAVLATPPSANSNVSFYSFGHSSVDSIVNAFLTGEKPVREERYRDDHKEDLGICLARKELGLPQWWEDDALLKSKNPQELTRAINSMSRLLSKVKDLRADDADEQEPPLKKQKKKKTEPTTVEEQTLVFQSGSISSNNNTSEEQDKTLDYNNIVMTEEELDDHIMSSTNCDSSCLPHNNNNSNNNESYLEIDFDELVDLNNFGFNSFDYNNETMMKMSELPVDHPFTPPSDIFGGAPDNNNFSTGEMGLDYGIDIHQLDDLDFDTSSVFVDDSLLDSINSAMNCVASGDGFMESTTTTQKTNTYALNFVASDDTSALNEDDINFSDYLTQFLQS